MINISGLIRLVYRFYCRERIIINYVRIRYVFLFRVDAISCRQSEV